MTSGTVTQPATRERQVLGGSLDKTTGLYTLVLDGNEHVTTDQQAVANAAYQAKSRGQAIVVELEARSAGQPPAVIELKLAPKPVAASSSSPVAAIARTTPAPTTTALAAAPALPTGLIHSPEQLTEQLTRLQTHYHVLSPAIAVADMAAGYGANLALVKIDPNVTIDQAGNGQGADCYFSKSMHKEPNKRSLNKQGIVKIGQASGVQWDPRLCRRTDDGSQRNYWAWTYVGYVRTHDGQVLTISGSRELDLRDGAAEAVQMQGGQLPKARAMGNELCETKAMLRALRVLGIRPSYTVEELQKPFLIVRFSFSPDMNDPEIKKLVTDRAMAGIGQLYTPPMPTAGELPAATNAPALTAKSDPFAEGTETATPAAASTASAHARPIGGSKVTDVAKFDGMSKAREGKPSKPYTRYTITFDSGEVATTFSGSHFETATKAKASGQWVKAQFEENEKFPDQLNLSALEPLDGSQPDLSFEGGKL